MPPATSAGNEEVERKEDKFWIMEMMDDERKDSRQHFLHETDTLEIYQQVILHHQRHDVLWEKR